MREKLRLDPGKYRQIEELMENQEQDLIHLERMLKSEIGIYLEKINLHAINTKRNVHTGHNKLLKMQGESGQETKKEKKLFLKSAVYVETLDQFNIRTILKDLQAETVLIKLKLSADTIIKSLNEKIKIFEEWINTVKNKDMPRSIRQKLAKKSGIFDSREYRLVGIEPMDTSSVELHFLGEQCFLSERCRVIDTNSEAGHVITETAQYLVDPRKLKRQYLHLDSTDVILKSKNMSGCSAIVQMKKEEYKSMGVAKISCRYKVNKSFTVIDYLSSFTYAFTYYAFKIKFT